MPEVVTLGECMAMLYPQEPIPLDDADVLALSIGGAEANLAIGLSRLGHSARFISRVGNDPFGARIRRVLAAEGVDLELIVDPNAQTGVCFREWLPDGARRVYYYRAGSAASHLTPADLRPALVAGARVVHLTGITPALSAPCAAAVARAIELARMAGARVSFDPNYRQRLWDATAARTTLLPLMQQADIVLLGHEDALALLGVGDDDDAAAIAQIGRALAGGPPAAQVIVLKRAGQGACALARGQFVRVPAHPVARVIDPVGAGDGFNAGFLAGWLRGLRLEESLRLGARIGVAAVATLGDYAGYPRAADMA